MPAHSQRYPKVLGDSILEIDASEEKTITRKYEPLFTASIFEFREHAIEQSTTDPARKAWG